MDSGSRLKRTPLHTTKEAKALKGAEARTQGPSRAVPIGIINVEVEIREPLVALLEGPKLLVPTFSTDPTLDTHNPPTPTLGLPISAAGKLVPRAEGTGGFFIAEGGGSRRHFLVTAHHVVFKPNKPFEHKSPLNVGLEADLDRPTPLSESC